ncbi:o-succinylbenzoic acid (OSB) synthetase [[Leptolyngbya] sp. PCC 7376]|uniref:o-succinylbenzoate synthase n=1 Tax=[Leptolyngbya] sp. PCC 7376 TaxID=111781 RepID=UPI00029F453D|nr:o-succinylbenzoate synthase [[Leptolyngbya] sp. PCC 7376]AFY40170.1 o-succinylbenzoic acid (OSB) synthetase [[Leptolyngbya] sp. PCC 7376]
MTEYKLSFQPYERRLAQPLRTNHGVMAMRQGIIVTLTNTAGRQSQGEIAPLTQFGTETVQQAIALCEGFGERITTEDIYSISTEYPACQFGFGSALMGFEWQPEIKPISVTMLCQLIPRTADLRETNPEQLQQLIKEGHDTFKIKIHRGDIHREIAFCEQILELLPSSAKLRLDANGRLAIAEAEVLFQWADQQSQIDFIEQPFHPKQHQDTLIFQQKYRTAITLDESVCTIASLKAHYTPNSPFIYVLKPAIMGFPSQLKQFCETNPEADLVFSTVFETEIGHQFVTRLAQAFGGQRAFGFAGKHWFVD